MRIDKYNQKGCLISGTTEKVTARASEQILPLNYHKHHQLNTPPPLMQLPAIFRLGLALLISDWGLWTGEHGIVESGWVLSPVPPSVYLPLPAGLLGESWGGGAERERAKERSQGTKMKKMSAVQSKHWNISMLALFPSIAICGHNLLTK